MNEKRLSEAGQVVRRHDHDRYLTALFAETGHREELFALYAFNYEIAKTAEVVSESMLGHIRLQWWREALEGLFAGMPRRHYVLDALAEAAGQGRLSQAELNQLIDAREQDLDRQQPGNLEEFEAYGGATAVPLLRASLDLMSLSADRHESLYNATRHLGIAYATVGLLRAIPFHAAQRQILLPADHLAVAGVDTRQLLELRPQENLSGVVMRLGKRAQEHLDAARALVSSSKQGAPVLFHGSLARLYLKRLAAADYNPFDPKVAIAPPTHMISLTWLRWRGRW